MKIICIGLNYRKHAIEMGRPFPDEPVINFCKGVLVFTHNHSRATLPKQEKVLFPMPEQILLQRKVEKRIS